VLRVAGEVEPETCRCNRWCRRPACRLRSGRSNRRTRWDPDRPCVTAIDEDLPEAVDVAFEQHEDMGRGLDNAPRIRRDARYAGRQAIGFGIVLRLTGLKIFSAAAFIGEPRLWACLGRLSPMGPPPFQTPERSTVRRPDAGWGLSLFQARGDGRLPVRRGLYAAAGTGYGQGGGGWGRWRVLSEQWQSCQKN